MRTMHHLYARRQQRGVSMIEALVALLVLALGIMGLAGIQTQTLVESRTTNARSIALQMADDLLDRMQANTPFRLQSDPLVVAAYVVDWGPPGAVPRDCRAEMCNGVEQAQYDLNQWKITLSRLLPAGDARVFQSNTDASQYGVLIGWSTTQAKNEASAAGADAARFAAGTAIRDGAGAIGTGVAGIACPVGLQCHLVYLRP